MDAKATHCPVSCIPPIELLIQVKPEKARHTHVSWFQVSSRSVTTLDELTRISFNVVSTGCVKAIEAPCVYRLCLKSRHARWNELGRHPKNGHRSLPESSRSGLGVATHHLKRPHFNSHTWYQLALRALSTFQIKFKWWGACVSWFLCLTICLQRPIGPQGSTPLPKDAYTSIAKQTSKEKVPL